jgi:hypothetical protein
VRRAKRRRAQGHGAHADGARGLGARDSARHRVGPICLGQWWQCCHRPRWCRRCRAALRAVAPAVAPPCCSSSSSSSSSSRRQCAS